MEPLYEALAYARDLPLSEQRELLKLLTENIEHLAKVEYVETTGFCVGDEVIIELRRNTEVKIKINGFSRDGMGIQGVAADGCTFIVSASQCTKA